jgi:hypothetical protein
MSGTPTFDEIRRAIIASLSPDLLERKYREQLAPDDPPETGHCAVASEAFYHIAGGRKAGFMPVVCGYASDGQGKMKFGAEKIEALKNSSWHKETHWWVRGPKEGRRGQGRILDVTARQYPEAFPYEQGHNTGFMQPQQKPSKRAQVVIDRVTELLGDDALKRYREANIAACRAASTKALKFKR